jgi:hypothetical protein
LDALLFVPKLFEKVKNQLAYHEKQDHHLIAPNIVSEATSHFERSSMIFTDGSRS